MLLPKDPTFSPGLSPNSTFYLQIRCFQERARQDSEEVRKDVARGGHSGTSGATDMLWEDLIAVRGWGG